MITFLSPVYFQFSKYSQAFQTYFGLSNIGSEMQLSPFLGGYYSTANFYDNGGGQFVLNDRQCPFGCPSNSYCDQGICRCRPKFMVSKGLCWEHQGGAITDPTEILVTRQENIDKIVGGNCVHAKTRRPITRYCQRYDINLVCREGICQCREGMRWRNETDLSGAHHASCQVFVVSLISWPYTMLMNCSKCEVKAWLCRKLIILPPLQFYVKSNFSEFKPSKNVNFHNFRGSEFGFSLIWAIFNSQNCQNFKVQRLWTCQK